MIPGPRVPGSQSARDDLEVELQGQLQFSRVIDRRSDHAEIAVSDERIRSLELRMIEDVEGFGAKLEMHSFAQLRQDELFKQRDVEVFRSRLPHAGDRARSTAERKGSDRCGVLEYSDVVADR